MAMPYEDTRGNKDRFSLHALSLEELKVGFCMRGVEMHQANDCTLFDVVFHGFHYNLFIVYTPCITLPWCRDRSVYAQPAV